VLRHLPLSASAYPAGGYNHGSAAHEGPRQPPQQQQSV